jgi:DNA-binding HxlR family transcriptional regulator
MKKSSLRERACSVARALDAVGDAWSMLLVRELFLGTRRFDEFQAQTGASPTIVSRRLARLVERGIARRVRYQERPPRDEFRLTRKGLDLWPVIVALMQFGDRWEQRRGARPLLLRHLACNHESSPALACSHCRQPIGAHDSRADVRDRLRRDRVEMRLRLRA